jgi:hypothetical protein
MADVDPLIRLRRSDFRMSFHLTPIEQRIVKEKGIEGIREEGRAIVEKRLRAADPNNDGRQTPKSGHPIFVAQHATATCCRKCLSRWHGISRHRELTDDEMKFVVGLCLRWIRKDMTAPRQVPERLRKSHMRRRSFKRFTPRINVSLMPRYSLASFLV